MKIKTILEYVFILYVGVNSLSKLVIYFTFYVTIILLYNLSMTDVNLKPTINKVVIIIINDELTIISYTDELFDNNCNNFSFISSFISFLPFNT